MTNHSLKSFFLFTVVLFVIVLGSTVASLSYGQQQPKSKIDFDNYTSSKGNFSMDYPAGWSLKERTRFDSPNFANITIRSNATEFPTVWTIFFGNSFLGTPANAIMAELLATMFIEDAKQDGYTVRVVEPINLTKYDMDGENAGSYIYGLTSNTLDLKEGKQTIITKHNGTMYVFRFLSLADEFDSPELTEIRDHMIKSIKWLPSNQTTESKGR